MFYEKKAFAEQIEKEKLPTNGNIFFADFTYLRSNSS